MDEVTMLVLSSIYTFPLSAIGVYFLWEQIILPRLKTRRGHIKVSRIMASGHFKDFWVKPKEESSHQESFDPNTGAKRVTNETGYFFKIGKKDDAERMTFVDSPDLVYFQGPVKRAFYDTEGNQISINRAIKMAPAVNPKMLESLAARTWNAARATAFADRKNIQMLIMIAIIAAIGAAFVSAISIGMLENAANKIDSLSSQIAGLKNAINGIKP